MTYTGARVLTASVAHRPGSTGSRAPRRRRRRRAVGIDDLERRAAVDEHFDLSAGRPEHLAAVRNDGARHGLERRRLRQRRREPVQARGPRDQRAVTRLAGPQRALDLEALGQLLLGAAAHVVGFGARVQGRLELPRAIERLGRADPERLEILALGFREGARRAEFELHDREHAAADEKGHGRDRLERSTGETADTRRPLAGRLHQHDGAASDGVGAGLFSGGSLPERPSRSPLRYPTVRTVSARAALRPIR